MKKLSFNLIIFFSLFFYFNNAIAIPRIDITKGNIQPLPIALNPIFTDNLSQDLKAQEIIAVIKNDLEGSGLFRSIDQDAFIETLENAETKPNFLNWRQINSSALFVAGVNNSLISFKIWDPFSEKELFSKSYDFNNNYRTIAHKIADDIYTTLTGEEGYFNTKIAFIAEHGNPKNKIKRLAIMDQDGANIKLLTEGKNLVLTPRFSPDNSLILYMSYEKTIPQVYLYNLKTSSHKLVGNFPGMSYAPKFSPTGEEAVMSVAENGSSDIYLINLKNNNSKRLTKTRSINTSPHFSPNGNQIVFSSDRGIKSQLYIMDKNGNNQKRISYGEGSYFTPAWSPRGDFIAFTKILNGKFHIGIMRADGTGERILTEGYLVEGPSWSPNGRVIIFTRGDRNDQNIKNRSLLETIDVTGYYNRTMELSIEASDPNWSARF